MKPLQAIKAWRERRFQKRVLNALGATINEAVGAIVFDKTIYSRETVRTGYWVDTEGILRSNGTFIVPDGSKERAISLAEAQTLDIDEIHNSHNGCPV